MCPPNLIGLQNVRSIYSLLVLWLENKVRSKQLEQITVATACSLLHRVYTPYTGDNTGVECIGINQAGGFGTGVELNSNLIMQTAKMITSSYLAGKKCKKKC